jgi:hypothetical protein
MAGSDALSNHPDMAPDRGRSRLTSVCTTVALALAFAGCGSGSSHIVSAASHAAGSTAPADELVTKADTICKRVDTVLVTSRRGSLDLPAIARSAPHNAALERVALTELSELKVPASLSRDWAQIVAYRRTLARELVELGRAARADDRRAVQALAKSKMQVHYKLSALARRDGFRYCSGVSAAAPPGH